MASRIALNSLRASGTSILHILPLYSRIRVYSVARETPCCPPTNPLCVSLFARTLCPLAIPTDAALHPAVPWPRHLQIHPLPLSVRQKSSTSCPRTPT